jgi:hypothetical protein
VTAARLDGEPITVTVPGAGTAVITRVRTAAGRDRAEVRLSLTLPAHEPAARRQLAALLTHLRALIGPPRAA